MSHQQIQGRVTLTTPGTQHTDWKTISVRTEDTGYALQARPSINQAPPPCPQWLAVRLPKELQQNMGLGEEKNEATYTS